MKLRVGIAALPLSLRKASGFPRVCFGLRLRLRRSHNNVKRSPESQRLSARKAAEPHLRFKPSPRAF